MNPEDYVSYPIALALKKAGFDWKCDRYYCAFDNETDVRFWSIHPAQSQNGLCTPQDTVVADAPTLAQAQKWLREKKELIILIGMTRINDWFYGIYDKNGKCLKDDGNQRDSYEQAISAGIAAALELIKKESEIWQKYLMPAGVILSRN